MDPLRFALALLAAALVALGAFVLRRDADPAAAIGAGHVYTGCADEPESVNPYTAVMGSARKLVLARTHEALLDLDPVSGALRPALASSHRVAADGLSCTFTLREGVQFSDGSPLTMQDVLFGWELRGNPHLQLWNVNDAFERVERAAALDERQLLVTFRGAHYAATEAVGCNWLVAQRAFLLGRVQSLLPTGAPMPALDSKEFADAFLRITKECGPGTGPYALLNDATTRNWQPHDNLLLVQNAHSWRRRSDPTVWTFAGIRVLFRSPEAATHALLRSEIDWFTGGNARELHGDPSVAEAYQFLAYGYRTLGVFRVVWNCREAPFADVRVRTALAQLFDRDAIVKMLGGEGVPAVAHALHGEPGHPDDVEAPTFDPAAARRSLRAAGFDAATGTPLKVRLLAGAGGGATRRIVDLFVAAGKDAGVVVEPSLVDSVTYEARLKAKDWDALLVLQGFRPWGDPYDLLHSRGMWNFGAFADAEVDADLVRAQAEPDPTRRAAIWANMHRRIHQLQPAALLVEPRVTLLLNRHVQGAAIRPLGLDLEHAFVPTRHQRR